MTLQATFGAWLKAATFAKLKQNTGMKTPITLSALTVPKSIRSLNCRIMGISLGKGKGFRIMTTPDFKHTKKAWPEWERENKRLKAMLDDESAYKTMEAFNNWEKLNDANDRRLQDAFYEDTKEYNSLHHCRLVSPHWLQKTIIEKE
jgi:hypothetical protein